MISTNIVCPLIEWCLHNTQKQLITRCRFKQLQLLKEEKEKLKIILKKGKIHLVIPNYQPFLQHPTPSPKKKQLPISVLSTPNWSLGGFTPSISLVVKSDEKLLTCVAHAIDPLEISNLPLIWLTLSFNSFFFGVNRIGGLTFLCTSNSAGA